MNNDIRNFGAVGQQTRLTAGRPVQTRLHQYGTPGQRTQMPPQPPIQKKITQYEDENAAKKQKAQRGEWVRQGNNPADSLDELKNENADDKYEVDDWDDEFGDLDIEQQDSEQQGEWSASAESESSNLPDNGAATAEYASSSLDANNRPTVPDGWVDTTRADKSEVVRQAKVEAQDLGLVIEEGVYGLQLRSQRAFARNQPIAPYRGVRMTGIEADGLPNTYDKIVPSSDGEHVVVGDVVNPRKPSIASYANDPGYRWDKTVRNQSNRPLKIVGNAAFVEFADGMWLVSERSIQPGEEITVNYGDGYWLDSDPEIAKSYFKNDEFYEEMKRKRRPGRKTMRTRNRN